ncbi:MAG: glycosyltransferase family 39 protein [Candidatus Korobacteraceae bacterium]
MSSTTLANSGSSTPRRNAWAPASDSFVYSPFWMVLAGLTIRVVCILGGRSYHLDGRRWWAFEMANIGYSLALGHGFSSPWRGSTGPTAWTAPLYPWVASLAFRVLGVCTDGAAFALLLFNSVFSALTSWTIYRIARRLFSLKAAAWSGWTWAVFPFAIYWSVTWIWETTFSAFILSLLFMLTLEMEGDNRLWRWICYGLLWGILALSNTSTVSWLPFAGSWLAYQLYRSGKHFIVPVVLGALAFWAVITPWLVRNYIVFDKVIIRGDLGSELRAGNNRLADGSGFVPEYRPGNNSLLYAQYKEMGEAAFDTEQGRQARIWIAEDPARFLALSCRRVFFFWLGSGDPGYLRLQHVFQLCATVLAFGGLLLAVKRRVHGVFLFATLLTFFPLIYYITFPASRYRHAIDPELVVLAVWLLVSDRKPATSSP